MSKMLKGISLLAAIVVLGAGCAPTNVTPTPTPDQGGAAGTVPTGSDQPDGPAGGPIPPGAPVTDYEGDVSNPDQNY